MIDIHLPTMFNHFNTFLFDDSLKLQTDSDIDGLKRTTLQMDTKIIATGSGETEHRAEMETIKSFFDLFGIDKADIQNDKISTFDFHAKFSRFKMTS